MSNSTKVELKKTPGKNWGLHFEGANPDLYARIKQFVMTNTQYLDAPYAETVKPSHVFIQCDTEDYLFLEFWSNRVSWEPFVDLLATEFGLTIRR